MGIVPAEAAFAPEVCVSVALAKLGFDNNYKESPPAEEYLLTLALATMVPAEVEDLAHSLALWITSSYSITLIDECYDNIRAYLLQLRVNV